MFDIYTLEPYGSKLIVGVDVNPGKLVTKLNIQNKGMNLDVPKDPVAAITYERLFSPTKSKTSHHFVVVVFDIAYASPSTIAHEAVHVVNYIFEHVGVHLDTNNDEAQAYLTGYVVELMHKTISKYGLNTNKKRK
jgi:hypothetical protein